MSDPRALTPQEVADALRIAKNTVYELVKRGDLRAYKVGNKFRFDPDEVQAYRTGAVRRPVDPGAAEGQGFVLCGQDILLDVLARLVEAHPEGQPVLRSYLGSYNGLHALYHGSVQAATAHLWDGRTGQYNLPFLPYVLPGTPVVVVHLALRTVGFYVPRGNPKGLRSWDDLGRPDLALVNREKGSGMRVLADEKLRLAGRSVLEVPGYDQVVPTHLAAAGAVALGRGDYALGSEKAARQVDGLDFVALQQERYELVFRRADLGSPVFRALKDAACSPEFRRQAEGLGGYGTAETGRVMEPDTGR